MWTNSFSKATHLGHRLIGNATQRLNIFFFIWYVYTCGIHKICPYRAMASACSDKQFAHVCLWPIQVYLCACVSQRIPLTHVFQGWCRNLHTYFIALMKANELQISWGINAKRFLRENLRMQNPETVQTTHIQEGFFFLKTLNSQEKRPPYGHACCCVNQKDKKKVLHKWLHSSH